MIFAEEISVNFVDSLIRNYSVDEIIYGNYDEAEKKIRLIQYNDSGMFYLALGEIEMRKGNREKAILNFINSAEKSKKIAPFAFRRIGDMELAEGHLSYAVSAYRIAAQKTAYEPYRYFLYSKVDSLRIAFPDSLGSVVWAMIYLNGIERAGGAVEESSIINIENSLIEKKLTSDLYYEFLSFMKDKTITRRFFELIKDTTVADTAFDIKTAFEIAQELSNIDLLSAASDWLYFAMNKKDFDEEITKKQYLMFRAQLNYSMKNWSNVIKYGKEYIEKFGDDSDLIYKIGRSYRQNGDIKEAHKYYEKHTRLYPNSKTSHDILWYLAWEKEENKDFNGAKNLFEKLSNQKPIGTHGEEAGLRVGLLDFRQGKYDLALTRFEKFRQKFPNSSYVAGSFYWSARTFLAKKDTLSAKKFIDSINVTFPLTYYDFRSRQIFGNNEISTISVSDSIWYSRIDNISKIEPPDTLAKNAVLIDNLMLGIFLGGLGLKDEAELLFEPIENRNFKNYPIIVSLAKFYAKIGAIHHFYRLGRRIYWALPSKQRGEFSPEYIKLIYPNAYSKEINASAKKYDVEPELVLAVMRQESMFSPQIMSPVGATGLMQIMPYTGKEIADYLKVPFDPQLLLIPELNIDFGAYYLSKLLKQTQGDYVQTLAGYNGGPNNVKKWVKNNEDILKDEPYFVECIGFSQTRTYVKRCLENYWVYKLIHF
jgi:soluble lytic murein transglycosylase